MENCGMLSHSPIKAGRKAVPQMIELHCKFLILKY
jgi:hypothetical protein